ncbi:hypothetical protein M5D96_012285 [Drosophila gunungcola]|uniref:Uncharacterized protein n=1 Tax=Drosophila gunungcola TaxID=103775 RepID=A0A9P9YDI6_9MUSC|nr:hypothetical protein M5D96_012285 [Drosophila gunungcola]
MSGLYRLRFSHSKSGSVGLRVYALMIANHLNESPSPKQQPIKIVMS